MDFKIYLELINETLKEYQKAYENINEIDLKLISNKLIRECLI